MKITKKELNKLVKKIVEESLVQEETTIMDDFSADTSLDSVWVDLADRMTIPTDLNEVEGVTSLINDAEDIINEIHGLVSEYSKNQ